jgi:hypothetical protein
MPLLLNVLTSALQSWFQHDPFSTTPFQMHIDGASIPLRHLLFQQNQIGWDHVFQGRFSQAWSEMQDDYYARRAQSTESPKKRTGSSWQARLIGIIWKHWTVLWHMRNHDLHGEDERSKAMADRLEKSSAH